jgi:hypothetical protein
MKPTLLTEDGLAAFRLGEFFPLLKKLSPVFRNFESRAQQIGSQSRLLSKGVKTAFPEEE